MRKTIVGILSVVLGLVMASQALALDINFDNFVSPTDNDYVNNFDESTDYMQQTTGGITGGVLLPSWRSEGVYNNDIAWLTAPVSNAAGTNYSAAISFFYDTNLIGDLNDYTYPVQLGFHPTDDWNHYLIGGLMGTGMSLEFNLTGYYNDSRNGHPYSTYYRLPSNGWYRFAMNIDNVGGAEGLLNVSSQLFSLGETGLGDAILVGSDSLTTNDPVFSNASNLRFGIYSDHDSGTAHLDNLTVPVTPEPASMALLGLGGAVMALARRKKKA